jgi:hypothetical protein
MRVVRRGQPIGGETSDRLGDHARRRSALIVTRARVVERNAFERAEELNGRNDDDRCCHEAFAAKDRMRAIGDGAQYAMVVRCRFARSAMISRRAHVRAEADDERLGSRRATNQHRTEQHLEDEGIGGGDCNAASQHFPK